MRRLLLNLPPPVLLVLLLGACVNVPSEIAPAPIASPEYAGFPYRKSDSGLPSLAPLLRRVSPSVVNISVVSRVSLEYNPLLRDPTFRRFLEMFELQIPETPPQRRLQTVGSGVIVDARRGYVITNYHVIEDAEAIRVTLKDRRSFAGQLLGSEPRSDIALLRIEPQDLVALRLGDSDAVEVGDFVLAIGNPFGLGQTVTSEG
jgi:S1-C subfamily serine protease